MRATVIPEPDPTHTPPVPEPDPTHTPPLPQPEPEPVLPDPTRPRRPEPGELPDA